MRFRGKYRGGVLAFGSAGLVFVGFGIMLIVKPVGIALAGGTGRWGLNQVTSLFGPQQVSGFSVIFFLIALFFFAVARELGKE